MHKYRKANTYPSNSLDNRSNLPEIAALTSSLVFDSFDVKIKVMQI